MMSAKFSIILAGFFIGLYALSTAASLVVINTFETHLSPILLALFTFSFSALFFIFLNIKSIPVLMKKALRNTKPVLQLNISTAITWLTLFYALAYISPSISSAIIFGIIPITTTLLTIKQTKSAKMRYHGLAFSALVALVLIALSLEDIVQHADQQTIVLGLSLVLISGVASAFNNIYARELSLRQFTATEVLAVRFTLLIVLVLISAIAMDVEWGVSMVDISKALVIAGISIILPLFFLQKAIERIGPIYISFLLAFTPIITFFLQLLEDRYHFSLMKLMYLIALCLVLLLSIMVKYRLER